MATTITKDNFEQEVLRADKPVLLDFYADWCVPCRMLSPVIEEISNEVPDAKVCKVNVDEEPELASQFQVMSIPTLVVMKNGKPLRTALGVQPKASIMKMLTVS